MVSSPTLTREFLVGRPGYRNRSQAADREAGAAAASLQFITCLQGVGVDGGVPAGAHAGQRDAQLYLVIGFRLEEFRALDVARYRGINLVGLAEQGTLAIFAKHQGRQVAMELEGGFDLEGFRPIDLCRLGRASGHDQGKQGGKESEQGGAGHGELEQGGKRSVSYQGMGGGFPKKRSIRRLVHLMLCVVIGLFLFCPGQN